MRELCQSIKENSLLLEKNLGKDTEIDADIVMEIDLDLMLLGVYLYFSNKKIIKRFNHDIIVFKEN